MLLTPAEAEAAIRQNVATLPTVSVALRDASGCVLQQAIVAERDQPPFDRVAMDGIALSSNSTAQRLRIAGTQAAGSAPLTLQSNTDCIEVMTGAMLPVGCDCVIPVEKIKVTAGYVEIDRSMLTPWLNIHRRATDCPAGRVVLQPGTFIGAPELAVIASANQVHVTVSRMPRIAIVSTGNELIEPGEPIHDWQIRRSNVYSIHAALRTRGFTRVSDDHIADDKALLRARLQQHLDSADVVILSGGVSMGKFDYVPQVLAELGVREIFHKIAQRPGKPMWFGVRAHADRNTAVYALPGNPVSTLACLARYVIPGLRMALRVNNMAVSQLSLSCEYRTLPSLWTLVPVKIAANGMAIPQPTHGSGDFTSLIGSDGLVEIPAGDGAIPALSSVPFYRW
jgi:molybdopterin molybdotransferase